jgi:hypothetical protein
MSDIQYFTAEASFKYTVYNILDKNNNPLWILTKFRRCGREILL